VVDIGMADGRIASVTAAEPSATNGAEPTADAVDIAGWLLLAAPAEPHAHLDKALTAEMAPNPTGDLAGAITAWVAAAEAGMFTHDDMVTRVRSALDRLLLNGVTAVRSHVNCGAGSGISPVSFRTL